MYISNFVPLVMASVSSGVPVVHCMIVRMIEMHVHDQVLGHNLAQSLHVETRLVYHPIVELH